MQRNILKNVFGYDTFRPLQEEVIAHVLARRDTLAVMPTGGGKSLCYQIPALLFEGLTVVVSPLIALMKDQVEQLRAVGVPAVFLNSSLPLPAYRANMQAVRGGAVKLLYVAPETLLTPRLFELLDALTLDCLTIDEAHCISEWGHDFRPEYRQLIEVRRRYARAVCLALTATATPRVRRDITGALGFAQANELVASFNRANLFIEVLPKRQAPRQTVEFLERFKNQSGIVYCFSRKQVDRLAAYLAGFGYTVRPYHAGLEDEERRANQEAFIRDDAQIMVATIAFGMGINKPNVRFVLHYDLPKSIEGYYQEIGRAGRDGLPAHCLLLYSYGDAAKLRHFIEEKPEAERRVAEQHLDAMVRYAEDEIRCRRRPLLTYFGEEYTAPNCGNCDTCTAAPPALTDITIPAQKFLSCVHRTGERYGAGYIAEVLRGARTERIAANGHERLSTYGIGQEWTAPQWMQLARNLAQMDYLRQEEEYRTLSLTPKALTALRERSPILGAPIQEAEARARRRSHEGPGELEHDRELFEQLRQKRKQLADEAGVPPYVVFSDKTLIEMAAYFPQSAENLLAITGVGHVKAGQYGETFMALIRSHCAQRGIQERPKPTFQLRSLAPPRHIEVAEAFNAGADISALVQRYDVKPDTILRHLLTHVQSGGALRDDPSIAALCTLPPERQQAICAAFEEFGAVALRPIFDRFNGEVSYHDLHVLRLQHHQQKAARSSPDAKG